MKPSFTPVLSNRSRKIVQSREKKCNETDKDIQKSNQRKSPSNESRVTKNRTMNRSLHFNSQKHDEETRETTKLSHVRSVNTQGYASLNKRSKSQNNEEKTTTDRSILSNEEALNLIKEATHILQSGQKQLPLTVSQERDCINSYSSSSPERKRSPQIVGLGDEVRARIEKIQNDLETFQDSFKRAIEEQRNPEAQNKSCIEANVKISRSISPEIKKQNLSPWCMSTHYKPDMMSVYRDDDYFSQSLEKTRPSNTKEESSRKFDSKEGKSKKIDDNKENQACLNYIETNFYGQKDHIYSSEYLRSKSNDLQSSLNDSKHLDILRGSTSKQRFGEGNRVASLISKDTRRENYDKGHSAIQLYKPENDKLRKKREDWGTRRNSDSKQHNPSKRNSDFKKDATLNDITFQYSDDDNDTRSVGRLRIEKVPEISWASKENSRSRSPIYHDSNKSRSELMGILLKYLPKKLLLNHKKVGFSNNKEKVVKRSTSNKKSILKNAIKKT